MSNPDHPAARPVVDLRSDTITQPTPAMRQAIAAAEVGDDVFGDDPTVQRLEARTAELLGKEAAVFVPSGTMANQLAIRAHTEPGDEIIVEANAHLYFYEAGAPAALSGVLCRCLTGQHGLFTGDDLKAALRPANVHYAPTRLVCLENTHNRGGGSIWPMDQLQAVTAVARAHGLRLHLDGARLWNASAATGIAEKDYAAHFDSVNVCFSKGLGAPVGSALAGSAEFIDRARRFRKMFGGGMRQAGLVAAGALYALEHHRSRLTEDHANARKLADGLAGLPEIDIDGAAVETNILYFQVRGGRSERLVQAVGQQGVRMLLTGPNTIRAVTSLQVSGDDIEAALAIIAAALKLDVSR